MAFIKLTATSPMEFHPPAATTPRAFSPTAKLSIVIHFLMPSTDCSMSTSNANLTHMS